MQPQDNTQQVRVRREMHMWADRLASPSTQLVARRTTGAGWVGLRDRGKITAEAIAEDRR